MCLCVPERLQECAGWVPGVCICPRFEGGVLHGRGEVGGVPMLGVEGVGPKRPLGSPLKAGEDSFFEMTVGHLSGCSRVLLLPFSVPRMTTPARSTRSLSQDSGVWRVLTTADAGNNTGPGRSGSPSGGGWSRFPSFEFPPIPNGGVVCLEIVAQLCTLCLTFRCCSGSCSVRRSQTGTTTPKQSHLKVHAASSSGALPGFAVPPQHDFASLVGETFVSSRCVGA